MPASSWKPCRKLVAADFRRHALWGFDRSRPRSAGADETWVRPMRLAKAPHESELLFVSARVRAHGAEWRPAAVTVKFAGGAPVFDGIVLLRPRYCAMRVHGDRVPATERAYLERILPAQVFPLEYRARLRVGRRSIPFAGAVTPAWR